MNARFRSAVWFVKDVTASRRFDEQPPCPQAEVDCEADVDDVGGLSLDLIFMMLSH